VLEKLIIKDFVLIENAELDFSGGLNLITGETGSGKSLVFKAILLIVGDRTSGDLVFVGKKKAVIEAEFTNIDFNLFREDYNLKEYFDENELIIRREISSSGKSRSFLNDSPINLGELKKVTKKILELSSQHSTFSLLDVASHINILDSYSEVSKEKEEFKIIFILLKQKIKELEELKSKEKEIANNLEFWKYQLSEIKKISPEIGELEKITAELNITENAEMIWEKSSKVHHLIYGGNNSAYNNLLESLPEIEKLSEFLPDLVPILEEMNQAGVMLKEVALVVNDFKNDTEYDPNKINSLRSRISSLRVIEKKYFSIDKAIEKWEELEDLINSADNFENDIEFKNKEIKNLQISLGQKTEKLTEIRNENANKFSKKISSEISKLGMENAEFSVDINYKIVDEDENLVAILSGGKRVRAKENGCDDIEFLARTNVGHSLGSISNIASGGELSRIMLAIKSLVTENVESTLILDEIDTGISGRISTAVGDFMKEMGKQNQIIAISHSPQITARADLNFNVRKINDGLVTKSIVRKLSKKETELEVASLFSGENLSESSIKSAKELIGR
jgi:DNA repair protein RecN (Recombination protein N)